MKIKTLLIIVITVMISLLLTKNNEKSIKADSSFQIDKPLVVLRNNATLGLKKDNYNLVSTNFNSNVVGNYYAIYQNYQTNQKLLKKLYVINNSISDNSHNIGVTDEVKVINSSEKVLKYVKLNDVIELVVTIEYNEQIGQDEPTNNLFLICLENQNIKWKVQLMENCYCSVSDLLIDNNEIIITGQRIFALSGMDFYILKYSIEGKKLKTKYFSGMGYDYIEKTIISPDRYYICGYTTSTKGIFEGERLREDGFLISVDKENLKEKSISYYNKELNDSIINMCYLNNNLYLVQRYISLVGNMTHKILKVDKDGKILKEHQLASNNAQRVISIHPYNNNIILSAEDKITEDGINGTYLYEFDSNLKQLYCYISKYSDYHMYLTDTYVNDDKATFLYAVNTSSKCGFCLRTFDFKEKQEVVNYYNNEKNNNNLSLKDHTTIIKISNNNIYILDNYIIKINNLGTKDIYNEKSNPFDYDIIMNGTKSNLSDRCSIEYNINSFGLYNNLFYFENPKFDFCYHHQLNVLPNSSVREGQVYDNNLVLNFNGKGLLNGNAISTGYIINQPGKYKLIVEGQNSKTIEYNFEVCNISKTTDCQNTGQLDINSLITKNDTIIEDTTPNKEAAIVKTHESLDSKNNIIMWPLIVPSILAIFTTIVIIKGGKK